MREDTLARVSIVAKGWVQALQEQLVIHEQALKAFFLVIEPLSGQSILDHTHSRWGAHEVGQVLPPVCETFEVQVCHTFLTMLHHCTNEERPPVLAIPDRAEEVAENL
jgi:hypothetical protein